MIKPGSHTKGGLNAAGCSQMKRQIENFKSRPYLCFIFHKQCRGKEIIHENIRILTAKVTCILLFVTLHIIFFTFFRLFRLQHCFSIKYQWQELKVFPMMVTAQINLLNCLLEIFQQILFNYGLLEMFLNSGTFKSKNSLNGSDFVITMVNLI